MRDYTERTLDELSQCMVLLCNTYNSLTQLYPNLYVSTRHHVTMIPHYATILYNLLQRTVELIE